MAIATHLIKIYGNIDRSLWSEKELKGYVARKMKTEIESVLHPDLELFKLEDEKVEIWVFICAFPSEATRGIVGKWLKNHIMESGLKVENFEIEIIGSLVDIEFNRMKMLVYLE